MAFTGVDSVPITDLAVEAEQRGIDTLYVPEHTHIPTSRRTPFPAGGDLPDAYYRFFDPFVTLASIATATRHLRLGTAIALVAQHDPIVLAKTISTLDQISEGRVVLGCGFGWNVEEFENHRRGAGSNRWAIGAEMIRAMKELWANDVASFNGDFVQFEDCKQWPKPVQQPAPPIWLGGLGSDANFRRIVEFADGWFPLAGSRDLVQESARLRELAEDSGRDPASIEVVCGLPVLRPDLIERYREANVDEIVFALPMGSYAEAIEALDRFRTLIA